MYMKVIKNNGAVGIVILLKCCIVFHLEIPQAVVQQVSQAMHATNEFILHEVDGLSAVLVALTSIALSKKKINKQ